MAGTPGEETSSIALFCKVWGFLKYYHPAVASGKIDWDREFISRVNALPPLTSKQETSRYYSSWINSLGEVRRCKTGERNIPDSLKQNCDLAWLRDTSVFTKVLTTQLNFIKENRNRRNNYYVQVNRHLRNTSYENEKPYADSVFPSKNLRLLTLARYWNIINYFYPYKYGIGGNWDTVLTEMIPAFLHSADTVSYQFAILEMLAKINDSHSFVVAKYAVSLFGLKWAPFTFGIIDQKAVVTGFYNDSLCRQNDIRLGDVLLTADGKTIGDIIRERSKYIAASNERGRLRNFYFAIFNGTADSVTITFERNGVASKKTINRYLFKEFHYTWPSSNKTETYGILENNIGYINLGLLVPRQVAGVMKKLWHTKAIIFDLRSYPNETGLLLSKYLNPAPRPFAVFTEPDITYPGVFHNTKPCYCGKRNSKPYAGRVVLLMDERTQSQAEYTVMALKTAPGAISIGSQTAGADGDVSYITLPGNYKTCMTGRGVFFPNGGMTQRVGLWPDRIVMPSVNGIKEGCDEVMDKALEFLNN
ncbi:MAG: S41 family peptidase [Bacteroidota bacterium]